MAETIGGASSTVAYGYDALSRLTGETRTGAYSGGHAFGYDLAGNLTSLDSSTRAYDAANKITASGFAYDGDGNLLSDGVNTYAWDDRNKMTSRTNGGITTAYGYDGQGLRVVSQVGIGGKTFYVFNGNTLLGEINGAGVVQRAYTWGAEGLVSERLLSQSRSLWYHFGPQGETRQLTDGTGAVADAYIYSAYGQPVSSAGTDANPFRFGGKYGYYTEGASVGGAVLCTRRWYDPQAGRWLSRDPSGYRGGEDLYAYCKDDPINYFDYAGLERKKIAWILVGDTYVYWAVNWTVWLGDQGDISDLSHQFSTAGYEVHVDQHATKIDMWNALQNPDTQAVAFLGHETGAGGITPFPSPDSSTTSLPVAYQDTTTFDPFEMQTALGGRKLQWAILHVCESDKKETRDALVGSGGKFFGAKGFWSPTLHADRGRAFKFKGKWQRKALRHTGCQ